MEDDYIIVGRGSAGYFIARRLAEDGDTSLLLDRGGEPAAGLPSITSRRIDNFGSPCNWANEYAPGQPSTARKVRRRVNNSTSDFANIAPLSFILAILTTQSAEIRSLCCSEEG